MLPIFIHLYAYSIWKLHDIVSVAHLQFHSLSFLITNATKVYFPSINSFFSLILTLNKILLHHEIVNLSNCTVILTSPRLM